MHQARQKADVLDSVRLRRGAQASQQGAGTTVQADRRWRQYSTDDVARLGRGLEEG